MAETRYGFVDNGDVVLTRPSNNIIITNGSDCCNKAMSKIDEITKDAPVELDTFFEVAESIKILSEKIKQLEESSSDTNGNIDLSKYAKKSDLCKYLTKSEATAFITDIEFAAEMSKYLKKDDVPTLEGGITKEYLENALKELDDLYLKKDEQPQMDGYVTSEELGTKLEEYVKTEDVTKIIDETYEIIDNKSINELFNN